MMERAADGNSYRYHATGLPPGGDAVDDHDVVDGLLVEAGLWILRTIVTASFIACATAFAGSFVATGSVLLLAGALFAGHMAAKGFD